VSISNKKQENRDNQSPEEIQQAVQEGLTGIDAKHAENATAAAETVATEDSPAGSDDSELSALQEKLLEAQQQADENLEGWQRSLAEFSNFKKRTEQQNEDTRIRLKGELLLPLLDVFDDLKLAMQDRPQEGETVQWAAGIEMIFLKFQNVLNNLEVEEICEKGGPFDPNLHEAITYEESEDVEEGHVIDVFQSGYRIGERIIRPARVRVAR